LSFGNYFYMSGACERESAGKERIMETDLVCGMTVDEKATAAKADYRRLKAAARALTAAGYPQWAEVMFRQRVSGRRNPSLAVGIFARDQTSRLI